MGSRVRPDATIHHQIGVIPQVGDTPVGSGQQQVEESDQAVNVAMDDVPGLGRPFFAIAALPAHGGAASGKRVSGTGNHWVRNEPALLQLHRPTLLIQPLGIPSHGDLLPAFAVRQRRTLFTTALANVPSGSSGSRSSLCRETREKQL